MVLYPRACAAPVFTTVSRINVVSFNAYLHVIVNQLPSGGRISVTNNGLSATQEYQQVNTHSYLSVISVISVISSNNENKIPPAAMSD